VPLSLCVSNVTRTEAQRHRESRPPYEAPSFTEHSTQLRDCSYRRIHLLPHSAIHHPAGSGGVCRDVRFRRAADARPNTGTIFKFGAEPGLLVRTTEGELKAFSARCTHLNCTVQYDPAEKLIVCACHNGQFDLNGKNIAGPPPKPLPALNVNVRGDEIVVSRV